MAWKTVPDFSDENAVTNRREHTESMSEIVEVLYGAKNEQGESAVPSENDGHGIWTALYIPEKEEYQVLLWKLPESEGGEYKYGESENSANEALFELEENIHKKERLMNEAESFARTMDPAGTVRLNEITEEWKLIRYRHTKREDDLFVQMKGYKTQYFRALNETRKSSVDKKKALIAETKNLEKPEYKPEVNASDVWKQGTARMDSLMDEWKSAGYAGKEENDLWNEFRTARKEFMDARKAYYSALNHSYDENRVKKEKLVEEAKTLSTSTKWAETAQRMQKLREEWSSIGFAGSDAHEKLWKEFNGAVESFYARRKADREEKESLYVESAAKKEELIAKVKEILEAAVYDKAHSDTVKALQEEWRTSGYAGKEKDQDLWNEFRTACDTYYMNSHKAFEERHAERVKSMQEAIARRESQITNLTNQIQELEQNIATSFNDSYITRARGWIEEKQAKINELTESVNEMKSKL